ncbi:MAG TPA: hypothetical protein VL523_19465 [Terriglobia bacterium]|nr:hypothetical protein [Terriglobia bacterium]
MSRKPKHLALAVAAALWLAATAVTLAAGSDWKVVSSPNRTNTNNLYGTAAVSPSDVWAVGYDYSNSNVQMTLTERWNGTNWSMVPSPNPGTQSNCGQGYSGSALTGVAGVTLNDVWAVGYMCGWNSKTLAEHWNGAQWAAVGSPNEPHGETSTLVAVAAASTDDVWAVGNFQESGQYQWDTLVEYWDGTRWSIVESPNVAGADKNFLTAVAVVSSTDVWAVGYSETDITDVPLIEHYDGEGWSIVPSVYPPPSEFNELYGVAALSADDVWAVGYENENSQGQYGGALTEHWDGVKWTLVDGPVLGVATNLNAVAAVSSTNVWAVGYVWRVGIQAEPIAEHWNGTSWSAAIAPNPGKAAQLCSAASINGSVWAVGMYSKTGGIPGALQNPLTLTLLQSR